MKDPGSLNYSVEQRISSDPHGVVMLPRNKLQRYQGGITLMNLPQDYKYPMTFRQTSIRR